MGNASLRRQKKLARRLSELAKRNPQKFHEEWNKRVESWILEIRHRAAKVRKDEPGYKETYVFDILQHIENLLLLCGDEVDKLVGQQTRELLIHECCKVFAALTAKEIYMLGNSDYLRIRNRHYKPSCK